MKIDFNIPLVPILFSRCRKDHFDYAFLRGTFKENQGRLYERFHLTIAAPRASVVEQIAERVGFACNSIESIEDFGLCIKGQASAFAGA
jgi:hypothetical protein